MWHRRRGFWGGGFFWIFGMIFIMSMLGKAGVPGFVLPIIFFWVFVPWFFKAGKRASYPRARRRHRPRVYREAAPAKGPRTPPAPAHSVVVEPRAHDLSRLPAHCPACGGPADGTTVRWRGEHAVCGYCGTGLK